MPLLKNIISSNARNQDDRFIPDYSTLKDIVSRLKEMGYTVVLTQGVYDVKHRGHERYLEAAKACGDFLIVGVDTDELTRKRKQIPGGPKRPFDPLEDRVESLLHTRHVDIVTIRDVNHGLDELIEIVEPDVLIMSETTKDFPTEKADYLRRFCKEVKVLPPQADTSTTARLRALMLDGASQLAAEIEQVIEKYISVQKTEGEGEKS